MNKMNKKIIYIGAGLHTSVLQDFKNTKKFIFVDARPRNEYGYEYYYRPFYRDSFVKDLIASMKKEGFNLISKTSLTDNYSEINVKDLDSTLLHFSTGAGRNLRSERNVNYYISTGFPNDFYDNKVLQEDIKDCDSVLISGHDPNSCFIDIIKKPFHMIGYSRTYYPKNIEEYKRHQDQEERSIYNWLLGYILSNPQNIKSYTYVDFDTGEKTVCSSYENFYKLINK